MNQQFNDFIDKLIKDKDLRHEFADDPAGVLSREGIELPADYLPSKLDAGQLEERLNALNTFIARTQSSSPSFQIDKFSALAGRSFQLRDQRLIDPVATDTKGTII
jgi:hypothetical protein